MKAISLLQMNLFNMQAAANIQLLHAKSLATFYNEYILIQITVTYKKNRIGLQEHYSTVCWA